MTMQKSARGMTRRELLSSGVTVSAALVAGGGFIAHSTESWAMETTGLKPETMATILQVARDTYPHDRIADANYAIAIKGHDEAAAEDPEFAEMMESGVRLLDALARRKGNPGYLATGWESDRVALLQMVEDKPFFQTIRGGLVVGLYNQKDIWGQFGYEGASFEEGGYIDRGFDDIAWL